MAQLTREEILEAAVALVDEGPAALTMRSLADRLGVTPAALYYWFPAKDQLLGAVAGHLAERIVASSQPAKPWQQQLKAISTSVIETANDHPRAFAWVFTTYAKRPPLVQIDEALLEVLMAAGFQPSEALLAKGLLWRFLVGHLGLAHLPGHIDPVDLEPERHPRIHEVAKASAQLTPADYFAYGLEQLIHSLAATPRQRRPARKSG